MMTRTAARLCRVCRIKIKGNKKKKDNEEKRKEELENL
jgi:hypothetical protein